MNSTAVTTLSVCVRDHAACIRIVGMANFTSSVDFKRLMHQLQDDGCNEIVLDLRECRLMDSTFLGVMAGIGTRCDAMRAQGKNCIIELFRPTDRVADLLDSLGVLELFTIIHETPNFDCFQPIVEGGASKTELTRTCLEAHRKLMETSPENERRFKDASEFFAKALRDAEQKSDG
jgi:anti-sigma B factor antagonist